MKSLHLLILLLTGVLYSAAQKPESLLVITNPQTNCIQLRWAPTSCAVWETAQQYGYVLEKYAIFRNGEEIPTEKRESRHIKMSEMDKWEQYSDNKYVMVAAECVFGERESYDTFNPMVAYRKHNDDVQRYGFSLYCADMDTTAAMLLGLYYNDVAVNPDEIYAYTLRIAVDSGYCDTAYAMASTKEYRPLPPPERPYAISGNKSATIVWNTQSTPYYIAYHIEKSDDGKHFERISENPMSVVSDQGGAVSEMYFTDSLETNNQKYYYRTLGVNSFGQTSPPSEAAACSGKAEIKNIPELTTTRTINNSSVEIFWQYTPDADTEIDGFKIYRSSSTGSTKQLLEGNVSAASRSFIDTKPLNDNYYYISVYNSGNEVINPFPSYAMLIDSVPPAVPAPPEGYCDSLGRVTVYWQRSTDPDVAGYRLFRANLPDVEFVLACPYMIKDTVFTDTITLNTSNEYVYYRLKAVDGRDNQSAMSTPAAVARYDTIPPAPPRIHNVEVGRKKVVVSWHNSASGDVAGTILFRKTDLDQRFDTLAALPARSTEYADNGIEEGETYYYALKAVDNGGLYSELSNIVAADIPAKAEKISFNTTLTPDGVLLKWNTSSLRKQVRKTVVYRAEQQGELSTYAIVQGNEYTDTDVSAGRTFRYCIRHQFEDGTESSLSDEVKISF